MALGAPLLAASAIVFIAIEILPGDAAQFQLGTEADADTLLSLREQLGLARPAYLRYVDWLAGLAVGDLGEARSGGHRVATLLAQRAAVTVPLSVAALVLALVFGVIAALVAARFHDKLVGGVLSSLVQLGIAIPNFWLGIQLIALFALTLSWLPAGGFPGWRHDPAQSLATLILPTLALSLPQAAVIARVLKNELLENVGSAFYMAARARGLSRTQALWRVSMRHGLPALCAIFGLQFAFLLTGGVLIENVFNLPGLGQLLLQSLEARDDTTLRNLMMILVAAVVFTNALSEKIAQSLNPPELLPLSDCFPSWIASLLGLLPSSNCLNPLEF